MKKSALILALLIVPILIIIITIFISGGSGAAPQQALILTVWGTKPAEYFISSIDGYVATRPYVTVRYSQVSNINYRSHLIESWALGTGPDVFMFPADETLSYKNFMMPAPVSTTNYTYETTKQFGIKEETTISKTIIAGPTLASMRQNFVDTASVDLVVNGQIFGLPLTMESLILYSNRDLLNQARIALPAATWDQFVTQVPLTTVINSEGTIIQSGTSLGTSENVLYAQDILSLIILQNGGEIINTATGAPIIGENNRASTQQAILFYTDFAREAKSVYSWNEFQEQSLNAFAAGKVAYYIGVPSDEKTILDRSAGLSYDVTDMLQINLQAPVNLAKYHGFGVSKTSKNTDTSWNFIQYLTSNPGATRYAATSLETPARKDLIDVLLRSSPDPKYEAYAGQALSAVSWYKGVNKEATNTILGQIIDGTLESQHNVGSLIDDAFDQLKILAP